MTPLKDPKAEAYALHIQEIVKQLKKTSKKAKAENEAYIVPPEIAKEKYGGRVGESFYLFPNDAPSQEIIDAYERVKPYYGTGEDAVSFEMHLSHRQMTIMFVDGDLVIRKDRNLFIDRLTEQCLAERIQYAKENYTIDWDNAKIFIFPYKTIYFYISDSFEVTLGGGRSDLRNPQNWFTIPFSEDFDYKAIREQCREFVVAHPLDEDNPNVVELNMDDVLNNVAAKMAERKTYEEEQPEPLKEAASPSTPSPKNSGCMLIIGLILIPTLLLWLI